MILHRNDFEIFNTGVIYFDNSATTMKPKKVVDSIVDYYTKYTANAHRGDYDNSLKVDSLYEGVREKVAKFIHADSPLEVVFTSGTTDSLNRVVFGFMESYLKRGDEVLLTASEHASNMLPWFSLKEKIGIEIKYIPLTSDNEVSIENVKSAITEKTKVISIAHVTNVLGDIRPIEKIGDVCQEKGILFVVDGAQSVPHRKVDVNKNHIDFLVFSAHKMLGPTGVGVLYGKKELLDRMQPVNLGGGMNTSFDLEGNYEVKTLPSKHEAGTPNIAGVIGLGSAIDYLENIGMENIERYEQELRSYLVSELKKIPNVVLYNENIASSNVTFNLKDVFAQDTAVYLNHYHICVRAGNHCAKTLKSVLHVNNTCRISLYFYNTKEEVDELVRVLKNSEDIFRIIL